MIWILVILGIAVAGLLIYLLVKPATPTTATQPTALGNAPGSFPATPNPWGAAAQFVPPWLQNQGMQQGADPNVAMGLGFAASLAGSAAKVLSSYFSSED